MTERKSISLPVQAIKIRADQAGQRIDNFLMARLKGVPRSRVYRLLRKGEVRVNKGRIRSEYRLRAGDVLRIPPVRISTSKAAAPGQGLRQTLVQSVVWQSDSYLVINKPSGLAVHGGSGVNLGLIESLRAIYPEWPGLELVHRLDRETSGCLLLAKNRKALGCLQQQMRERSIRKEYRLLVCGLWPKTLTEVKAPLLKQMSTGGERIVRVNKEGKVATTYFSVLRSFQNFSFLAARLETGRTHQIRVHAKHMGYPLVGDEKYGNDVVNLEARKFGLKRLFLHAAELGFICPDSGAPVSVAAPLSADLEQALKQIEERRQHMVN